VKRALGPVREPGSTVGLTRAQAEAELRRHLSSAAVVPSTRERLPLGEVGERYLLHVERFLFRKLSTLERFRAMMFF
jgi:hypothetical protein